MTSSSPGRRRGWVWIVVGVALLCLGWSVYRNLEQTSLLRAHSSLMTLLVAGDFERAYRLTTDEYRANHTAAEFRSAFGPLEGEALDVPLRPSVISLGLDSAEVYAHEAPGFFALLNGPSFFYRKEQGEWRFTGEQAHYFD